MEKETTGQALYSFTVYGRDNLGNNATLRGTIEDKPGYPGSAFDKAVEVCRKLSPSLVVDRAKPGQVVLKQLKKPN